MTRLSGSIAASGAALLFGAVTSIACAMSSPADLTPDVDPTIPGLDAAASTANPTPGSQDMPADGDAGATGTITDSGAKTLAQDSGGNPVDAAPPPPVTPKPSAGEVLITEIMYTTNTPEPQSEWIELYNAATSARALGGLILKDGGGRTHLIAQAVTIAPGQYLVFARSKTGAIAAKVPSSVIAYEYGAGQGDTTGVLLANGATGGISLLNGGVTVATSDYGGWFTQSGGASIQQKTPDASLESVKTGWCLSTAPWTSGSDKGTPGTASDCP